VEKRIGVAALIVKTKSPPEDADAAVAVDPVSDNGVCRDGVCISFEKQHKKRKMNQQSASKWGGEI
jgi:hypothetical protein